MSEANEIITETNTELFDNLQPVEDTPVVEESVVDEQAVKPKAKKVSKQAVRTESVLWKTVNPKNTYFINDEANAMEEYTQEAFDSLVSSISKHTLLQPILLWWNKSMKRWELVDGRHRMEACNVLGRVAGTYTLPKVTKREDLPEIILTTQLLKRGLDKTICNCEAVVYLERERTTQKELVAEYDVLDLRDIQRLNFIKRIRPLWFKTLRWGDEVEITNGDKTFNTSSIQTLYKECKAEEARALNRTKPEPKGDGKKEVALAFAKMTPLAKAVSSAVGDNQTNLYAFESVMKQICKPQIETYGIPVAEQKILTLEGELKISEAKIIPRDETIKRLKQDLLKSEEEVVLSRELLNAYKKALPKTHKNMKMMAKIYRDFTDDDKA